MPVSGFDGRGALRHQHLPCRYGNAGKPCGRRASHRLGADRRQVDAFLLPGLRRLDQHANLTLLAHASRSAQLASMASVPSAASTASTWPLATTAACPISRVPSALTTRNAISISALS